MRHQVEAENLLRYDNQELLESVPGDVEGPTDRNVAGRPGYRRLGQNRVDAKSVPDQLIGPSALGSTPEVSAGSLFTSTLSCAAVAPFLSNPAQLRLAEIASTGVGSGPLGAWAAVFNVE